MTNLRLELIRGADLIPLLNENIGASWQMRIERLIAESANESSTQKSNSKALARKTKGKKKGAE